jgi:hypothetical protein
MACSYLGLLMSFLEGISSDQARTICAGAGAVLMAAAGAHAALTSPGDIALQQVPTLT